MYYEVQVLFIEEVQVKNGTKEKKVRKNYLVECDACSVAELKVREWLKDSPFAFDVKWVKESKIIEVVDEGQV